LSSLGATGVESNWITVLDAVLEARTKMDPKTVTKNIWNAFLVYTWVLVPSIQGW
jgi:hypothetical protein